MDNTVKPHASHKAALNTHDAVMPLHTHWSAQQLAEAVPLRLSQLIDFSADTLRACNRASANAAVLHRPHRITTFLPAPALPLFRTR